MRRSPPQLRGDWRRACRASRSARWGLISLGLLSALGCAREYELSREEPRSATVGEVTYEVIEHEAATSRRASEAKVARVLGERASLVTAVDRWLTWPQLHEVAAELYSWGFLFDEPLNAALLRATAAHLERVTGDRAALEVMTSEPLRARLQSLSPYAPSPLTALLRPGFGEPLSTLISWLALQDGHPSPQLASPERSAHLSVILAYAEDYLKRGEVTPPLALDALTLLFEELPEHRAPSPLISYEPRASLAAPYAELLSGEVTSLDWSLATSYQQGVAQDLRLSVGYALSAGLGEWWSSGAFGALQELLEALLPSPALVPAPLLGGEALAYPTAPSLTPLIEALLDLIDHPVSPTLLGFLGAKLPQDEQRLAELFDDLESIAELVDQAQPYRAGDPTLRGRGLIPDLIEGLADLLLFKSELRPRLERERAAAERAPLLSPREATLLMSVELMMALSDPVLMELGRVSALMMRSEAPQGDDLPPLGGPYDRCVLSCEREHRGRPGAHLLCLESCPRGELLAEQPAERLQSQSALERSLALIHDYAGHPYQMRVTHFRSDLFDALDSAQPLDPALLPPLLEIEDVASTFLLSVIGELSLESLVSPDALQSPQISQLLRGFDLLCEEGSVSNGLLNSVLPNLIEVTEEQLDARCQRFIETRALGDAETARRAQVAILVTMLSLLTDVPMSERPSTGELIRFFNLENPALYLGILDLELSRLTCAAGYPLPEHHGYALYAGEAAGLYQALSPLIRLAYRYDKLPALTRVLKTLYRHYGLDDRPFYLADRSREPTAGTGLVYLEPTLELILESPQAGRLLSQLAALLQDSQLTEVTVKARGPQTDAWRAERWPETLNTLGLSAEAWSELRARSAELGDPVWRETGNASARGGLLLGALLERALSPGAGPSGQGRLMALWRALRYSLEELDRDPVRRASAEEALELLWGQLEGLFERRLGAPTPQLSSQRPLIVSAVSLAWMADQLAAWGELGEGHLYEEAALIEELLTHPALYSALSLARDLRGSEEARALDALLAPLWSDPLSLTAGLYQLGALLTTPRLHELSPALAPLLSPLQSPALPQELLNLMSRLTSEASWVGWEELIRSGLIAPVSNGAEPLGAPARAPLLELLPSLLELTRFDPRREGPWAVEDLGSAMTELAQWLSGEEAGMIKALQVISARER